VRKTPVLLATALAAAALAGPAHATHTTNATNWKVPTEGATVSGVLQGDKCEATSSSPRGVKRVEFYVDDALHSTNRDAPYNCSIDSGKLTEGAHVFQARGITKAAAVSEHSINVTVDNTPDEPPPPPPSTLGPRAEHRGAQTHSLWGGSSLDDASRELDMLQSAGADTVRFDIGWASLEQDGKGQYSSSYVAKADAVFEAAAARGIKVIPTFWSTPCWASSAPDTLKQDCSGAWWDRDVEKYPPSDPQEYAEAAAWVARRWGDKMAAFEVWNEPDEANQSFLISPDPAYAYAQIVKAAYAPLKGARSTLPVIVGSVTFANRVFLEQLYDYGIQPYHDGISMHPYNEKRDPDLHAAEPGLTKWNYRDGVPWIRDLMVKRGDAGKGLWLTELGWTTCDDFTSKFCVTESQQAEYVNDAFRIQREDRWDYVKAMIVYNLRNKGTDPADREDQYGLIRRDFSPKPSWSSFTEAMTDKGL